MKKRLLFIFAFITMLLCFGAVDSYAGDTEGQIKYKGMANDTVNVREGPGTKYDKVMMEDKTNLQLHAREEIVILDEAVSDEGTVWYHLVVTRDGKEYIGYSSSNYVSKLDPLPTPTPTPTPEPTATPTPKPTPKPTADPTPTQPLVPEDNTTPNDKGGILKAILIVVIVGVVALIGLMVFKLLDSRRNSGTSTSRKIDLLKKVNLDGASGGRGDRGEGRRLPQIKKSDVDRAVREDVRSEVYFRSSDDDYEDSSSSRGDSNEKRALRDAIDRLQEHDIVYHVIYGEGEVRDNSDVKLIEVRFNNDIRFLKKDQLVAKRELRVIDEEDQSIARRRNRRRNPRR